MRTVGAALAAGLLSLAVPVVAEAQGAGTIEEGNRRAAHVRELITAGDWPGVLQSFLDSHPFARQAAFDAVVRTRDPNVVTFFIQNGLAAGDARIRNEVAEAMGVRQETAALPLLQRLLRVEDSRLWAARAIAMIGGDQAYTILAEQLSGRDDALRLEAAWGLGRIDAHRAADLLFAAASDARDEWQVRTVALDALLDGDEVRALTVATGILEQPRRAGAPALIFSALDVTLKVQHLAGHDEEVRRAVDVLIAFLDDTTGRPQFEAFRALARITGQSGPGLDANAWTAWWQTARDRFHAQDLPPPGEVTVPEGSGSRARVTFHGEAVWSERVTFVQDMSGSMTMNEVLVPPDPPPPEQQQGSQTGRNTPPPPNEGGEVMTFLAVAKRELIRTIGMLEPRHRFNIIFFETDVTTWQDEIVQATPPNRQAACETVQNNNNTGRTNWYGVVATALQDPNVDTVYIFSDGGTPTEGVCTDYDRILFHMALLNRTSHVRINAILVNIRGRNQEAEDFLRELTETSGGRLVTKLYERSGT